jgi:transcription-repair coupling factor (superfamily II helicase)
MDKYFYNNRIENIKEIAGMIQRLVPNARVGIGHGQMEGRKLEELMLAFMNGEFDVLVPPQLLKVVLTFLTLIPFFNNNAIVV